MSDASNPTSQPQQGAGSIGEELLQARFAGSMTDLQKALALTCLNVGLEALRTSIISSALCSRNATDVDADAVLKAIGRVLHDYKMASDATTFVDVPELRRVCHELLLLFEHDVLEPLKESKSAIEDGNREFGCRRTLAVLERGRRRYSRKLLQLECRARAYQLADLLGVFDENERATKFRYGGKTKPSFDNPHQEVGWMIYEAERGRWHELSNKEKNESRRRIWNEYNSRQSDPAKHAAYDLAVQWAACFRNPERRNRGKKKKAGGKS